MFNSTDKLMHVLVAFTIALAILSVPLFLVGRAIVKVNPRVRFTLRRLFAFMTVVAVSFGIARLPLPAPLVYGLLFVFLTCAFGFAFRYPIVPGRPAASDRGNSALDSE